MVLEELENMATQELFSKRQSPRAALADEEDENTVMLPSPSPSLDGGSRGSAKGLVEGKNEGYSFAFPHLTEVAFLGLCMHVAKLVFHLAGLMGLPWWNIAN